MATIFVYAVADLDPLIASRGDQFVQGNHDPVPPFIDNYRLKGYAEVIAPGLYMYFQPFFDDPTVITAAGWDQFVDAA